MSKVFVYGTLKTNGYNNSIMGNSKSLGAARTACDHYTMYDGGFPMVIKKGPFFIKGELFDVTNDRTLENLDRLEGVPHHFDRHNTTVILEETNEEIECFMYVGSERFEARTDRRLVSPDKNNVCEWVR